jgi:ribonuclease R
METLRDRILVLMREADYRPLTEHELGHDLRVRRGARDDFSELLAAMVEEGEVILVKGNRYGLPGRLNLVVGRLTVHPDGFGFIAPDEGPGPDVFVRGRELNTALHGDRVVARRESTRPDGRSEGRVIRILERARSVIVGRYEARKGYGYLTPHDPRIAVDVNIPAGAAGGAVDGDMAVAEIVDFASKNRVPEGRIVEVLGKAGQTGVDEAVVIRQHGLPHRFAPATLAEAGRIPREVTASDLAGRTDFRELFTVTIDGETAKDFDDAVSLEAGPDGGYRLWVHIADVSHYVRPGTSLDREALERGTSVYFPGTVIPMLPEALSNGICSLNPRVDRLAFSAIMEFDRRGRMRGAEFADSVINSNARMTYTRSAISWPGERSPSVLRPRPATRSGPWRRWPGSCARPAWPGGASISTSPRPRSSLT